MIGLEIKKRKATRVWNAQVDANSIRVECDAGRGWGRGMNGVE